ncbi:hypothetical protein H9P43_003751 [Blastocladiella emersonii ATCC 22665]|nr:hypothetical protein H9P43_003751 [Blastocladiella emersonii ATCC 22665]
MDSDVIGTLRPRESSLSPASFAKLSRKLSASFTKAQIVAYLREHGTPATLCGILPAGTYLGPKTKVTKPVLIEAILRGVWGLGVLDPALSETDPVMAKVNAIPDQAVGTLDIPCSDRDLFFVHGYGETIRSLMLQGGVRIKIDAASQKLILRGSGAGMKKTVAQLRSMLVRGNIFFSLQTFIQYKESSMTIPMEAKQLHRYFMTANKFMQRIMRQCSVYMEEHGNQLQITATSPRRSLPK